MRLSFFTYILLIITSLKASTLDENWLNLLAQNNFDNSKQSYCFQLSDKTILSNNLNKKIRPASVSKLFTALWALEKLTKDYQHTTKFKIQNSTLYIEGSKDPFFVSENLLVTVGEIQKNHKIEKIVFDKNFYLNWSKDKRVIKKSIEKVLNSKIWSNNFIKTVDELELFISDYNYDYVVARDLNLRSIEFKETILKVKEYTAYTFSSSPLWMHLKQVNIYSNNFYADTIFETLGGATAFHTYLYNKFGIDKSDTYFFTGSGLGENRTTCSTTLKVLNKLREYSNKEEVELTNLVSVAGVDQGTLVNRFTSELNKKVLAKTGTLRHTSTLAGFLNDKHQISFAIFNHTYQLDKAREMQEDFVYQFSLLNKLTSFEYTPKEYISIQDSNIKKGTY